MFTRQIVAEVPLGGCARANLRRGCSTLSSRPASCSSKKNGKIRVSATLEPSDCERKSAPRVAWTESMRAQSVRACVCCQKILSTNFSPLENVNAHRCGRARENGTFCVLIYIYILLYRGSLVHIYVYKRASAATTTTRFIRCGGSIPRVRISYSHLGAKFTAQFVDSREYTRLPDIPSGKVELFLRLIFFYMLLRDENVKLIVR